MVGRTLPREIDDFVSFKARTNDDTGNSLKKKGYEIEIPLCLLVNCELLNYTVGVVLIPPVSHCVHKEYVFVRPLKHFH